MKPGLPKFYERNRSVRNLFSLRIAGILTVAFYPTFWILDWFVIPDHVVLSGVLRAICSLYGGFLIWGSYHQKRWMRKNCRPLTYGLGLSLIWSISIMCWVHVGLESPYYAGINTVLIVMTLMFSWTRNEAALFHALVYGFYISPLVFGLLKVHDVPAMLGNQFFLLTTQILTFLSQDRRVTMEIRELTQRRTLRGYLSHMRKLATTDVLTSLFNRRHLLDLGEREFKRCLRYQRPFSVIIADIDWFKKVNDNHGHRVGDEVIQGIAKILKANVRAIDIVGRYGGEEFLILLPETDSKLAVQAVCARIQKALKDNSLTTSVGQLKVTLSLGVSDNTEEKVELPLLIHRADVALYEAKRSGRNREVSWSREMETKSTLAA